MCPHAVLFSDVRCVFNSELAKQPLFFLFSPKNTNSALIKLNIKKKKMEKKRKQSQTIFSKRRADQNECLESFSEYTGKLRQLSEQYSRRYPNPCDFKVIYHHRSLLDILK